MGEVVAWGCNLLTSEIGADPVAFTLEIEMVGAAAAAEELTVEGARDELEAIEFEDEDNMGVDGEEEDEVEASATEASTVGRASPPAFSLLFLREMVTASC